jgi:MoaA/NifB/PqqE/SkfB family radical SAM enzyme
MDLLKYTDLVSPFIQPKVLFHIEKFEEIYKNNIPVPVTCEIDLTDGFCNNKCSHCFFGTNEKLNPIFLEKSIAISLIRELADHGVKGVEFSGGGEPTTHPDICEIIEYATSLSMSVGLITNGLLLDKISHVANKMNFIRISLDAGTKSAYTKVHGVNTFEKVISNTKLLMRSIDPIKVGVGFLIVKDNIDDILPATILVKELGCRFIQFRPASLTYDLDDSFWEMAHNRVLESIKYTNENFQVFDAGVKWRHLNNNRCYLKCSTSTLVSVIKASGDIPFCILNRNNTNTYLGNIYDGGFFKHWFSNKHAQMIKNIDVQKCRKPCKHDSYNIAYEAYIKDLYHKNFI